MMPSESPSEKLLYPMGAENIEYHRLHGRFRVSKERLLSERIEKLIERIRSGIIGDDRAVEGPFGVRRVTYADYTASGRSLDFIEDFIRAEVMPLYANTHTETSTTGLQTTRFREDARRIILEALHGTDDDVVIFCGSGATCAINKLIDILNLRLPADLDERYGLSSLIPEHERPVVFITPTSSPGARRLPTSWSSTRTGTGESTRITSNASSWPIRNVR